MTVNCQIFTTCFVACILALAMNSCTNRQNPAISKISVPEGYVVEVAAGPDLVDYPMFVTVDETGRLFVFESIGHVYKENNDALTQPKFRIKLLVDTDADGKYDKSTIFADKVGFPQGGVFYEGSLYASSAPDLLKFTDTDNDGVADKREVLLSGWTLNINANSLIGPFLGPDGWLYMTSAIEGFDVTTKEGQQLKGETSRIWRVKPYGSQLEWISAGGMNNPVGLTFTAASEPLGTMTYLTNPTAGIRDAIMYWTEGGIYPKPNSNIARDSLPLTGELMPAVSKYSRVAPSGITRYRSTALGDDYFDNLFTAQFNTHRVLRHQLIRDGASFKTMDEVFFSTDNEDFHPTDVQEDGDGSLLIVETGGWFIQGCPLSQVSKPELKGSIYRVKRKNAPRIEDPFGNTIDWKTLSPEQMVTYLEDARPFVVDRTVQALANNPQALTTLTQFLSTSKNVQSRIKAVFALYRMGTAESIAAAGVGLTDAEQEVRLAAARVAGLAKDKDALTGLMNMLNDNSMACRRQAATALGQLGDTSVISGLMNAVVGVRDRFVQHAITYALITLNDPKQTRTGLQHTSSDVKRVAMIALDQMQEETLSAGEVFPYLLLGDSLLQTTTFWVISHHPEWAGDMVRYLGPRMSKSALTTAEEIQLREILVAYSNNAVMQQFIAAQFGKAPVSRKMFLIETMAAIHVEKFPLQWIALLKKELSSNTDQNLQLKILGLARLNNLTALTQTIEQVANQKNNETALRMAALGFLITDSTALTNDHFTFLLSHLQPDVLAPNRQQAATILSQGLLSQKQLLTLATEFLPQADAFIIPRILPAFRQGKDITIGEAVVNALLKAPTLDSFSEETLRQIFKNYPAELNTSVEALIAKLNEVRAERLTKIKEIEADIVTGDIERGRALFFGKAVCYTCHAIGKEGGKFAPDLTGIQRDRSPHDLVEAIVYPSASFVREYETYQIVSGQNTYRGVILEQNAEFILLAISAQETVRLAMKEITSIKTEEVSMMPQGLDQLLSKQELADLLAFLIGQEQDPETDSKLLR